LLQAILLELVATVGLSLSLLAVIWLLQEQVAALKSAVVVVAESLVALQVETFV
jgi:hypothetical protein